MMTKQVPIIDATLTVFKSCQKLAIYNREVRFNHAGRYVPPLLGERAGVRASVTLDACRIYFRYPLRTLE